MAGGGQSLLGNVYRPEISIDGGTTYVKIGGVTSFSTTDEVAETKCSDFDTEKFNEYLLGLGDVTADVELNLKLFNLGQERLIAMHDARLSFKLRLYPKKLASSGIPYWEWEALSTSKWQDASLDETQTRSFSFRLQNGVRLTQS